METETFVNAKAIRGEADVDMIRVSEEGRWGRRAAAEWPQSLRGGLNLQMNVNESSCQPGSMYKSHKDYSPQTQNTHHKPK